MAAFFFVSSGDPRYANAYAGIEVLAVVSTPG
jgi:hypothetical protein